MRTIENVTGVILAGGLSRRMGEKEKSLMSLGDATLLETIANRFSPQVSALVLNANGDSSRFSHLGLPVQPDTLEGFPGPLAGVLAGMRWAKSNTPDYTHLITVAADTPFFPKNYVSRMLEGLKHHKCMISLAKSCGRRHPVFGLWDLSIADELENFLVEENERKVMLFVNRYPNCQIEFEPLMLKNETLDPFFNINTPEELDQARQHASELGIDG